MHYLLYILGVCLLTLPTAVLGRKRLKGASLAEIFERKRQHLAWLHPVNGFDLVRAYGGLTLLLAAFTLYEPSAPAQPTTRIVLALGALLGLLLQHVFHPVERDELPAPVAYAIGLVAAILPPEIALLALPLGIVCALALQNLGAGLVIASLATACLGQLFGASLITVATASLLLFLPVLLAWLFQRRLVLNVRRGREVRYASLREIPITASR